MKTEHPITPPPELITDWCASKIHAQRKIPGHVHVAIQAARWGADQELEACCADLRMVLGPNQADWLRSVRRPKPPSLKEQALAELDLLKADATVHGLGFDAAAIRRALEALPDV